MKKKQTKQELEDRIEFLKEQHPHLDDSCFEHIGDEVLYKKEIEDSKFISKIESLVNNYAISYIELINFRKISNFQFVNISLN